MYISTGSLSLHHSNYKEVEVLMWTVLLSKTCSDAFGLLLNQKMDNFLFIQVGETWCGIFLKFSTLSYFSIVNLKFGFNWMFWALNFSSICFQAKCSVWHLQIAHSANRLSCLCKPGQAHLHKPSFSLR